MINARYFRLQFEIGNNFYFHHFFLWNIQYVLCYLGKRLGMHVETLSSEMSVQIRAKLLIHFISPCSNYPCVIGKKN